MDAGSEPQPDHDEDVHAVDQTMIIRPFPEDQQAPADDAPTEVLDATLMGHTVVTSVDPDITVKGKWVRLAPPGGVGRVERAARRRPRGRRRRTHRARYVLATVCCMGAAALTASQLLQDSPGNGHTAARPAPIPTRAPDPHTFVAGPSPSAPAPSPPAVGRPPSRSPIAADTQPSTTPTSAPGGAVTAPSAANMPSSAALPQAPAYTTARRGNSAFAPGHANRGGG